MRGRWYWFLVVGAVVLSLGASANAQPGGFPGGGFPGGGFPGGGGPGGGGPPGGFGGMRGGFDPSNLFNMMANGKDSISRDSVPPQFQGMFDRFAERMGIQGGTITREQFTGYMQKRMAERGQGGPPGGGPGGPPGGGPPGSDPAASQGGGPPGGGPPGGGWGGGGFNPDLIAEGRFRQMDANGDGLLNFDEMDDTLKAERDKYDTDRNGFVDLNEFKEYIKARIQQFQQRMAGGDGQGGMPPGAMPGQGSTEEETKRPQVFRAGRLPTNLPSWFKECDQDGDGQVGLYEWKKGGRPMDDFAAVDRNGDGFITVEEALRTAKPQSGNGTAVADNRDRGDRTRDRGQNDQPAAPVAMTPGGLAMVAPSTGGRDRGGDQGGQPRMGFGRGSDRGGPGGPVGGPGGGPVGGPGGMDFSRFGRGGGPGGGGPGGGGPGGMPVGGGPGGMDFSRFGRGGGAPGATPGGGAPGGMDLSRFGRGGFPGGGAPGATPGSGAPGGMDFSRFGRGGAPGVGGAPGGGAPGVFPGAAPGGRGGDRGNRDRGADRGGDRGGDRNARRGG